MKALCYAGTTCIARCTILKYNEYHRINKLGYCTAVNIPEVLLRECMRSYHCVAFWITITELIQDDQNMIDIDRHVHAARHAK